VSEICSSTIELTLELQMTNSPSDKPEFGKEQQEEAVGIVAFYLMPVGVAIVVLIGVYFAKQWAG